MAELLRMSPKESMSFDGPALQVDEVRYRGVGTVRTADRAIEHFFAPDNATALTVPLPEPVSPGESVTVELKFHMKLPPKKGRWGQWQGITTLAQWLPVLAVHDGKAWQPTPFIPWHQP